MHQHLKTDTAASVASIIHQTYHYLNTRPELIASKLLKFSRPMDHKMGSGTGIGKRLSSNNTNHFILFLTCSNLGPRADAKRQRPPETLNTRHPLYYRVDVAEGVN